MAERREGIGEWGGRQSGSELRQMVCRVKANERISVDTNVPSFR